MYASENLVIIALGNDSRPILRQTIIWPVLQYHQWIEIPVEIEMFHENMFISKHADW